MPCKEYTRVKLRNKENDYINASYIQYSDVGTALASSSSQVPTLLSLQEQNDACTTGRHYQRYISTQGPLPATFNDFWALLWDENSRIIVMLTKEEEMNRVSSRVLFIKTKFLKHYVLVDKMSSILAYRN